MVRGTLSLGTFILLVACMLFCHRTIQHDADFAVDIMTKLLAMPCPCLPACPIALFNVATQRIRQLPQASFFLSLSWSQERERARAGHQDRAAGIDKVDDSKPEPELLC